MLFNDTESVVVPIFIVCGQPAQAQIANDDQPSDTADREGAGGSKRGPADLANG
jgi:hypothetical protein